MTTRIHIQKRITAILAMGLLSVVCASFLAVGGLGSRAVHAQATNNNDPAANGVKCDENCIITTYINPAIKIGSSLVGVIITISIVYAGIQYASSAGDPNKVAAARQRIMNAVLALLAFLFLFAFLNWIVPGGI